jgi:hypothetical protein
LKALRMSVTLCFSALSTDIASIGKTENLLLT